MAVWLKEWAVVIGAGVTFLAVIVALGIGISSLIQTKMLQKAEKRERLLNEIIQWVTELQTASLGIDTIQHSSRNVFIMTKYATAMAHNEYIRAMVNESFKEDLAKYVENLHRTCAELIILMAEAERPGASEVKYSPTGYTRKIKDETQAKILQKASETGKARILVAVELRDECEIILAGGIDELLIKIGKIKAKLVIS